LIHINEVAKQTKITVRTLRYYDQIGLLTASSKTEGGHRLYSEEEMKKLQSIQFFKGMGYKLQDIKEILTDSNWNWSNSLESQLAYIVEEQERLRDMESSVRELMNGIAVEGGNQQLAIQKLIQLSSQNKKKRSSFKTNVFNDSEMKLWTRLPKMKGEDPNSLEWIALLGQIKQNVNDDPASLSVQNVIRRMLEKQSEEFKDDDDFINKLWELRKSPTQSEELGLYPIDQEVLDFMERAYDIHVSSRHVPSCEQGGKR